MTENTPLPFDLPAVHRKKVTVDFNRGNQSSDAGLLLLREAERKLGVCQRLAAAIPDHRDSDRILKPIRSKGRCHTCDRVSDQSYRLSYAPACGTVIWVTLVRFQDG
jgi:hypothetical protein